MAKIGSIEVNTEDLETASLGLEAAHDFNIDLAFELTPFITQVTAVFSWDSSGHGIKAAENLTEICAQLGLLAHTQHQLSEKLTSASKSYEEAENLAAGMLAGPDQLLPEIMYVIAGETSSGVIGDKLGESAPPIVTNLAARLLFGAGYYLDLKLNGEDFARKRRDERMEASGLHWSIRKDAGLYLLDVGKKSGVIRSLNEESVRSQSLFAAEDASANEQDQFIDVPLTEADYAHNNALVGHEMDRLDEQDKSDGSVITYDGVMIRKVMDDQGNVIAAFAYLPGTDPDSESYKGGSSTWANTLASANSDNLDTLTEGTANMQLTDKALEKAGVGSDVPLYMSGFSQGSLTAVSLSTNKEFRSKYKVAGMHLQGAPVGDMKLDNQTPTVIVNDKSDAIPHLQGSNSFKHRGNNVRTVTTDFNSTPEGQQKIQTSMAKFSQLGGGPFKAANGHNAHGYEEYEVATQVSAESTVADPSMEKLRKQATKSESSLVSGSTFAPDTTRDEVDLNRTTGLLAGTYEVAEDLTDNMRGPAEKLPDLPDDFTSTDVYDNYIDTLTDDQKAHLNSATKGVAFQIQDTLEANSH
ncbi:MAG: hypothetical protein Q3974_07440 [Rothia sp. (in: high G+C Gram-positive bacteria)]|nr:hypothetical protein [Rothia sp. (in: high G+C Gram-positive bacteria)]